MHFFRPCFRFVKIAKTWPLFFYLRIVKNWQKESSMLERDYQAHLIAKIKKKMSGCVVLKNDSSYLQGFPDLLILYGNRWAALEVKISETAHHQPNQDYYVDMLDHMSYAAFIFPENEEDILDEVQRALQSSW